MTPRNALVWRLVVPVVVALAPLSLVAQSGVGQTPDDILKQQTYQAPPKELADAVLATRYLNVSLTNASPDKKWFVDEIGDGPVVMKTFAKPFHELGAVRRLQGEPRQAAHGPQQHRHPDHLRCGRI